MLLMVSHSLKQSLLLLQFLKHMKNLQSKFFKTKHVVLLLMASPFP